MSTAPPPRVLSYWRGSARRSAALVAAVLAMWLMPSVSSAQTSGARTLGRASGARPSATSSTTRALARGTRADTASSLGTPGAPLSIAAVSDSLGEAAAREPFPLGLELALATQVPLSVGAEATVELPLGFLLRGHVGFMPSPYVGIVNEIASGIGAYGAPIASLVDRSGGDSLVLRFSGGIRPVPGYGFEILAGYTRIGASTRVSVEDFEAATGQSMSWPGVDDVGIDAELHMLHVHLGWTALAWDHLAIRVTLGWAHTLAASTRVDVPDDLREAARGRIEEIERDVHDGLTSYGFTPEVGLSVGYRL